MSTSTRLDRLYEQLFSAFPAGPSTWSSLLDRVGPERAIISVLRDFAGQYTRLQQAYGNFRIDILSSHLEHSLPAVLATIERALSQPTDELDLDQLRRLAGELKGRVDAAIAVAGNKGTGIAAYLLSYEWFSVTLFSFLHELKARTPSEPSYANLLRNTRSWVNGTSKLISSRYPHGRELCALLDDASGSFTFALNHLRGHQPIDVDLQQLRKAFLFKLDTQIAVMGVIEGQSGYFEAASAMMFFHARPLHDPAAAVGRARGLQLPSWPKTFADTLTEGLPVRSLSDEQVVAEKLLKLLQRLEEDYAAKHNPVLAALVRRKMSAIPGEDEIHTVHDEHRPERLGVLERRQVALESAAKSAAYAALAKLPSQQQVRTLERAFLALDAAVVVLEPQSAPSTDYLHLLKKTAHALTTLESTLTTPSMRAAKSEIDQAATALQYAADYLVHGQDRLPRELVDVQRRRHQASSEQVEAGALVETMAELLVCATKERSKEYAAAASEALLLHYEELSHSAIDFAQMCGFKVPYNTSTLAEAVSFGRAAFGLSARSLSRARSTVFEPAARAVRAVW